MVVTAKRNSRSTASNLSHQLSSTTGATVSKQAVYRRLGKIGLYARSKLVRCAPLTATQTHHRLWLAWSRKHTLWAPQQWVCVMFSDESRFNMESASGERHMESASYLLPLREHHLPTPLRWCMIARLGRNHSGF